MERCLEIFLIMRYLHVRSQEHERGGERGDEQICKCFAIHTVFRVPLGGRKEGIWWLDLLWPSQWTTKKTKQKRAKWRKNARGGGGKQRKAGKGNTLCKFCVLTTNPKTQLAQKTNTHAHSTNVSVINNYKTAAKTEQNKQKERGKEREKEKENTNEENEN